MGLDMYLIKAKKVADEEAAKTNVEDLKCSFFYKTDTDESLIDGLRPLLTERQVEASTWDMAKIRKGFDIPEDAIEGGPVMWGGGETVFSFFDPNDSDAPAMYAAVKNDEEERYTNRVVTTVYLIDFTTVGYWRKNFPLADAIAAAFEEDGIAVDNCGYYPLTESVIGEIEELSGPTYDPNDIWSSGYSQLRPESPDELICYHEWY